MSTEVFADSEFDKMLFNVHRVPAQRSIVKAFSRLGKVPEFKRGVTGGIDKNKAIRYVCLMYDKNTPFRTRYPDIMKRKIEVAMHAGFKLEDGGIFPEKVEDMLSGKNASVNRLLVAFVRLHRNVKYSYLVSIEESFYFLMEEVTKGEMKNLKQLKEIQDEIEETVMEMLNDDDNKLIKDDLFKYIEDERLKLRPEDIARKNRKLENARSENADPGES